MIKLIVFLQIHPMLVGNLGEIRYQFDHHHLGMEEVLANNYFNQKGVHIPAHLSCSISLPTSPEFSMSFSCLATLNAFYCENGHGGSDLGTGGHRSGVDV